MDQCFAAGAVVRDEGKTITGVTAIKAWRAETGQKYQHSVEPLAFLPPHPGQTAIGSSGAGSTATCFISYQLSAMGYRQNC